MSAPAPADVVDLYLQVGREIGRTLTAAAAVHDLTPMQAMTLMRVGREAVPSKDLARHLGCDPSNATGLVDQLERRGLVARFTPPTDRRVRAVEATEQGRSVQRDLDQGMAAAAGVLDRLGPDDLAELHRLLRLLATGGTTDCARGSC